MKYKPTLAAIMAMAFAVPVMAADIPETELNVVGSIGILSMYKDMESPFWNETIKESSDGAIKANLKPFNELGFKGGELFSLVSNGTVQMAHQVLAYTSGSVPMNEATDLVGVVADVEAVHIAAKAFRDTHAEFLAKDHNIKLLGYGTYQSQVIYCRDAFTSIADMKGRKVRASGASQQVFIEHLGGSPIGMSFGEVPTAMANGTIDCAITGALSGYQAKWHEPANYISALPINHGVIAHIANMDWWNSVDPAAQAVIEAGLTDLEEKMFALAKTETTDGLACNSGGACAYGDAANMTLVPVTDADRALRTEAANVAVLPAYKERCGEECSAAWNATIGAAMGFTIN
ncbi:TRAP transporter substrate-binding protein [Pararhizobium sp. IMCC21322]|uniref:TRAP transporter substrate-binding protein n=1 Tax=Pararhizobium sp. IMCC21322 TaxID=3067903 RepID=UPI002741573F|nr:TRAP transporter substrate-binding protein [Pararhizobium sp. IMCC21322]